MKFVRIIALKPLYTFLSGIRNKDGTVINMLFNSAAKNIVPETLSRKLFYQKDVILTIFYLSNYLCMFERFIKSNNNKSIQNA